MRSNFKLQTSHFTILTSTAPHPRPLVSGQSTSLAFFGCFLVDAVEPSAETRRHRRVDRLPLDATTSWESLIARRFVLNPYHRMGGRVPRLGDQLEFTRKGPDE